MISYYISLILTCLMLVALPKGAFMGNRVLMIVMMLLYSSLFLLYTTRKGQEFIQKKFANPFLTLLLLLVLINLFFVVVKGTFSIEFLGKSMPALLIPALMVYFTKTDASKFHPLDIIIILLIYSIIFLKILNLPLVSQQGLVTFNGGYSTLFFT